MSAAVADLTRLRATQPDLVRTRALQRPRPDSVLGDGRRLMVIAADHPARGALGAGGDPHAMADRRDLLGRLVEALGRPGVNGFLGTADVVEDLLLLGALDDKVVFGSMNRGGIAGTSFEIDDRFTGYDAAGIEAAALDGGKMLLRIDPEDAATAPTLEATSRAVTDLAARRLVAMVEPFMSRRVDGAVRNDLSPEAVVRSAAIAAGLGATSAYTWLKLPVVDRMETVLAASTLPVVLLGGEVSTDQDRMFERWHAALAGPSVVGLTVGRSLLYPPDGDVAAAVDTAVGLL
ncbi:MAG: 5-keto-2-deoxy-D-gluconate-6 phosphate aldolase [form 2] [uncultured Nocardioidaceae bacterium]|uniref:5-keto-2-deoxy-D-gluconate-6 phosphate aldolase [form 2] n=1 Tax=uncultured Nocardioidaceae bacterium TaxID=253824 RepID=A0A6J4LR83_9ACTN|nr:MAG: 5-keto-2-deoxy-D-gluconate-6 phosphate aldolase [form 2] [uncultured Nocardioidaceae bacterium]